MKIVKRFLEWIQLKEKLHINTAKPPLFKEGEIWWCSLGENIGTEINGKSKVFTRPVVVYKKLSHTTFLALPTTSQNRAGSWYVDITLGNVKSVVILSQARVVDYKRLFSKLGQLDAYDIAKIKEAFVKLYA
jgi:mRNA-degrading endonuclease toxin of MazEF toxin-antitoxin module